MSHVHPEGKSDDPVSTEEYDRKQKQLKGSAKDVSLVVGLRVIYISCTSCRPPRPQKLDALATLVDPAHQAQSAAAAAARIAELEVTTLKCRTTGQRR